MFIEFELNRRAQSMDGINTHYLEASAQCKTEGLDHDDIHLTEGQVTLARSNECDILR